MKKILITSIIFLHLFTFLNAKIKRPSLNNIENFIASGEYETAKNLLQNNINNNYKYVESSILMGNILISENNLTKARKYFQKTILKTENKKLKATIYNKIADTYEKENQYQLIKILKEAILENSFDAGTLTRLGISYEALNITDQILPTYEKAYELKPDNIFINQKLAELYENNLDYEKAIFHYEKISNLTDINYFSFKLAELYFKTGKNQKAIKLINKKDISKESFLLLGNIYYSDKNYKKALGEYSKAFKLNQTDKNTALNIYATLLKLGKKNDFIEKTYKNDSDFKLMKELIHEKTATKL
jgi:tetratricopeptide (TPR) repeat protein